MSILNYLLEELTTDAEGVDDVTPKDTKLDSNKKSKIVTAIENFKNSITKDSVPTLLKHIERGIPKMNPAVREPAKDIIGLIGMVHDWLSGDYKELPWETILTVIAVVTYVVSPVDVIPDVIPVAGVIDDVYIISKILPAIQHDIAKYREWKNDSTKFKPMPRVGDRLKK